MDLNENEMFNIICAFDAKEVLMRQNARETDIPHLKELFLEAAEKAHKNMYKWIKIRKDFLERKNVLYK